MLIIIIYIIIVLLDSFHFISSLSLSLLLVGGPGYIMNRVALRRLHHQLTSSPVSCMESASTSSEDVFVSHCLMQTGVEPLQSCHIHAIMKDIYNSQIHVHTTTSSTSSTNTNATEEILRNDTNITNNNTGEFYRENIFHHFSPAGSYSYQPW